MQARGAMEGFGKKRKRRRNLQEAREVNPEVGRRAEALSRQRGPRNRVKGVKDKKLRRELRVLEEKAEEAAVLAAENEILLTETGGYLEAEGMERTYNFKQKQIREAVDLNTQAKMFSLDLPRTGPYRLDYSANGRWMLLGGKRGHVALVDLLRTDMSFELTLGEEVRDVCCLHNETLSAVAQKRYVYIYDQTGLEVHSLRKHIDPLAMTFLPFHYLLASVGRAGWLKYQDVSTGQLVGELRTKLGPCDTLAQNPSSAVLHCGHGNGVVTMWSPVVSTPLVRMLCHRGPVRCVAVAGNGRYMATSGGDGRLKVWDLRTFGEVHAYTVRRPPTSLSISQSGLLCVGTDSLVQVWKDAVATKAKAPYMNHEMGGMGVRQCLFRPYEDIVGIGHGTGFSSIVVPGAGEANYDALQDNPFETRRGRQDREVRTLLEKLPPETIVMDQSTVAAVAKDAREVQEERRQEAAAADRSKPKKEKKKARGRSKIGKRLQRKRRNVVDEETVKLKATLEERRKAKEQAKDDARADEGALRRFF